MSDFSDTLSNFVVKEKEEAKMLEEIIALTKDGYNPQPKKSYWGYVKIFYVSGLLLNWYYYHVTNKVTELEAFEFVSKIFGWFIFMWW